MAPRVFLQVFIPKDFKSINFVSIDSRALTGAIMRKCVLIPKDFKSFKLEVFILEDLRTRFFVCPASMDCKGVSGALLLRQLSCCERDAEEGVMMCSTGFMPFITTEVIINQGEIRAFEWVSTGGRAQL